MPVRNAAGMTAQYFGGPVTENAKVYVVWWGDPANLNPAITAAKGVVFVVSTKSAESAACLAELAFTKELGKVGG